MLVDIVDDIYRKGMGRGPLYLYYKEASFDEWGKLTLRSEKHKEINGWILASDYNFGEKNISTDEIMKKLLDVCGILPILGR